MRLGCYQVCRAEQKNKQWTKVSENAFNGICLPFHFIHLESYHRVRCELPKVLRHITYAIPQYFSRNGIEDFVLSPKAFYSQHHVLIRLSYSVVCLTIHNVLFTIIINGKGRKIRFVGNAFFSQCYTHQALSDDTF